MKKGRVFRGGTARRFCLRLRSSGARSTASLGDRNRNCAQANRNENQSTRHFGQTGNGRSITSHFTFGSFSFDKVNGRRIAIARSVALTSRSHNQRMFEREVKAT